MIDWLVIDLDPNAQRVTRDRNDDRRVEITPDTHQPGMADVYGRLSAVGGATLDKRLDSLAATVCPDDPRTKAQRRADALLALADGATTTLACTCGTAQCPAAEGDGTTTQIVVHVIAEQDTVSGEGAKPGYVLGFGPIPADAVRKIAKQNAVKVKPLVVPNDPAPEAGYRPSAALAEFVRNRDLGCHWPGCDAPTERCDLDHTRSLAPWADPPVEHQAVLPPPQPKQPFG